MIFRAPLVKSHRCMFNCPITCAILTHCFNTCFHFTAVAYRSKICIAQWSLYIKQILYEYFFICDYFCNSLLSKSKVFGCTNILSLLFVHQLWKDLQDKWPFLHWDLYYIILINFLFRDHDEEFSVIDAAKKLNEVQSMKGLGRFFKQVAQSARPRIKGGDVDDFLGCITVPIKVRCHRKIIL